MTRVAVAVGGLVVWSSVPQLRPAVVAIGVWVVSPPLLVASAMAAGLRAISRRLRVRRASAAATRRELPLLGELVGLGLTAGLPFPAALAAAAGRLQSPLRGEVEMLVRAARSSGLELALAGSEGAGRDLYAAVASAMSTGAPVADGVRAFVAEAHARRRAAELTVARRLPVKLVVPLALLILPGFVLLTVAPAFVGAVERLGL